MRFLATALLLTVLSGLVNARQNGTSASLPNMTGKWTLIDAGRAPADIARNLEIVQDPRTFEIVASDGQRPRVGSHIIGIAGGTVPGLVDGATDPNGERTQYSTVARNGSLVFEQTSSRSDKGGTRHVTWQSEVWSLADGRLTIQVHERQDDRQVQAALLVYRRPGTRRE